MAACQDNEHGLDPNVKINGAGVRSFSKAEATDTPAGEIAGTGITDSFEFGRSNKRESGKFVYAAMI